MPEPKQISEDEIAARNERLRAADRARREESLLAAIGKRYSTCELKNFDLGQDDNRGKRIDAVKRCQALADNLPNHIADGGNVVICGPPGTGKDHLLVGLLKYAVLYDAEIQWRNGQELYRSFRDQIDSDRSEASLVNSFVKADILAISDPVPPKGTASDYAAHMLYQIVDARYRAMKGTWVTANVANKAEAVEALSAPIFDRLLDNSFTLFCSWPSYRQTRKPEWLT